MEGIMASSPTGSQNFDISRVVTNAFGALSRNLPLFLGLAVVLAGLPTLILNYALLAMGIGDDPEAMIGNPATIAIGVFAGVIIALIANALLQAALIRGTVVDLSGGKPEFSDCINTSISAILPLIGIGLVSGIGIAFGMLLLIVPGVILALMWSVATPAYIEERQGVMASLSRSNDLTSGYKGNIFLLYLVILVVAIVVSVIAGIFVGLLGTTLGPAVEAIIGSVSSLISGAIIASLYVELRMIKEGVTAEKMAAIFS
jgi:hypothetical protein